MPSDNSTIVNGKKITNTCKMQAAYLSKLIYEKPAGSAPFTTCFPDEIKKAKENWEEWEDFDFQDLYGLVQRLYKPKGYDPNAKNDEAMCWPVLVHRGTDFDDFRGLGYAVSLHWPELGDALQNWKRNISDEMKLRDQIQNEINFKELNSTIEEFNKRVSEMGHHNFDNPTSDPDFKLKHKNVHKEDEIIKSPLLDMINTLNFKFEDGYLFKVEQWLDVKDPDPEKQKELSQINWAEAKIIKQKTIKGKASGVFAKIGGEPKLEIKLVTRLDGPQGDWAANVLQGIGDVPQAYYRAMRNALTVTRRYIGPTEDKRFTITGHSLGGGLAAAADYVTRHYTSNKKTSDKKTRDKNVQNYTIVFNPAGIHQNTKDAAEKIANNGPNIHDGITDIYYVTDEILTTLAWTPQQIPFLLGAMNILQEALPKPEGGKFALPAIWPGPLDTSYTVPSPTDLPAADSDAKAVIDKPYGFPKTRLFPINQYEDAEGKNDFRDILALSEIFSRYSTMGDDFDSAFGLFLNDVVDYFDTQYCGGSLKIIFETLNIDDEATWQAIKKLIFDNAFGLFASMMQWKIYDYSMVGYMRWQIDWLMKILNWANQFHGMDYVIKAMQEKFADNGVEDKK